MKKKTSISIDEEVYSKLIAISPAISETINGILLQYFHRKEQESIPNEAKEEESIPNETVQNTFEEEPNTEINDFMRVEDEKEV